MKNKYVAFIHHETYSETCYNVPNFADNIIWELNVMKNSDNQNEAKHYARILYNGSPLLKCKNSGDASENQDGYCELKQFLAVLEQKMALAQPYDDFCFPFENYESDNIRSLLIIFGIISAVLLVCLGTLCYKFYKFKRFHREMMNANGIKNCNDEVMYNFYHDMEMEDQANVMTKAMKCSGDLVEEDLPSSTNKSSKYIKGS